MFVCVCLCEDIKPQPAILTGDSASLSPLSSALPGHQLIDREWRLIKQNEKMFSQRDVEQLLKAQDFIA